jgi:ribosomal protein L11 methyltransferase
MDYVQITFPGIDREKQEILIAFLSMIKTESFQEMEDRLVAFFQESDFDEKTLKSILDDCPLQLDDYEMDHISDKNWNKLWEQNFQPVVIAERCLVRAPFHKVKQASEVELIIEPQMSFGTAHHATTALMIELMLDNDFKGTSVLDMGSGTGILAILASVRGAGKILAIDNNVWAFTNSAHNLKLNKITNVEVLEGDKSVIPNEKFDFILANINRNVLLADVPDYVKQLNPETGVLILSGFLNQDAKAIEDCCFQAGLKSVKKLSKADWVAEIFSR